MDQPLVSVIIANYNYGQYVGEAIESVLGQEYQHIQLIVVDDGSNDNSLMELNKYVDKLQLITQPNKGVVAARNRGLGIAQGKYVVFLDADDVLHPQFLSKLVEAARAQNRVLAYCDTKMIGTESAVIPANRWNWRKLLYRNYLPVSSLVERQALERVGGFSDQDQAGFGFEDWDLWLKLAECGFTGAYVPEVLFFYRQHGRSRNREGLAKRRVLEKQLRQRHVTLYRRWDSRLYLLIFQTASRIRNKLNPPPGV